MLDLRGSRALRVLVSSIALTASVLAGCGERVQPAGAGAASEVADAPAGAPAPAAAGARSGGAPLVILVSIDTLRADHLGLYGYGRFTSPVLDSLAAEGAVFEDASSSAPWTLPAHASLLTGRYPVSHRVLVFPQQLPADVPTLAGILRARGYTTAAVVSTTFLQKDVYGLTRDFEKYLFVDDQKVDRREPLRWVTDQAIAWLDRRRDDEPMLLFVHYFDVHADYASEPVYEKLFVRPYSGKVRGTVTEFRAAGLSPVYIDYCRQATSPEVRRKDCVIFNPDGTMVIDEHFQPTVFDQADFAHLRDLYDAGVRQLDTELGRLIGRIDAVGPRENTLLIVLSDHGEELGDHGHADHSRTMYQEVIRVPLLMRGSGIPPGARYSAPVSLVDVAPTVLARLGIPKVEGMEGLDLSPLWNGGAGSLPEDRLIFEDAGWSVDPSYHVEALRDKEPRSYAVRKGRYKLYYDSLSKTPYRLFDLSADPGETRDVSPQHPELAAELRRILEDRQAAVPREPAPALDDEEKKRLQALGYM